MGAESVDDELYNYKATAALLDWGFSSFGFREVIGRNQVLCEIPVKMSQTHDYVTLVPSESLTVFLPADVDIAKEITVSCRTSSDWLDAPVKLGQKAGVAMVSYGDDILGTVDLVTTSDVGRSELLFALERIKAFSRGGFFIATVIAAVVFTLIYILIKARYNQKKLRSRVPYSRGRRYR